MSWITDQDAPHFNIPDEYVLADQKATPVDADRVLIEDSADGFTKKYADVGDLPGGGGGSVDVEDDDVFVAAADTLNFGPNLTVTDDGGGKVTVDASGGGGGNAAYAETIGDNTNTTYTVTHNLGTTDLVVQLWDLTGTDPVEATGDASSIDAVSVNAIEVTFAAAPPVDSYRVVILADGGTGSGGWPHRIHIYAIEQPLSGQYGNWTLSTSDVIIDNPGGVQDDEVVYRIGIASGTYTVVLDHYKRNVRPIYTFALSADGSSYTDIGTIDGWSSVSSGAGTRTRDTITGATVSIDGLQYLRIKHPTRNASATGWTGAFSNIAMVRTGA